MSEFPSPSRRTVLFGSLIGVIGLVGVIIVAVYYNVLTIEGGGLLMSAVLAVATFAYVLLTYSMASTMRDQIDIEERRIRLQKKPKVKAALQNDLLPLYNNVMKIKREVTGTGKRGADMIPIDGEFYRAYHDVSPEFDPEDVPRFVNNPVSVNPGNAFGFYQTVKQYRETYGEAVYQLEMLIVEELGSPHSDSDELREFAELALQLDDGETRKTRWDTVKDDVIPLRKEIPDLIRDLNDYRDSIRREGAEVARELWEAQVEAMREFEISESELHRDEPGEGQGSGSAGAGVEELPRREQFAAPVDAGEGVESESGDGER